MIINLNDRKEIVSKGKRIERKIKIEKKKIKMIK